MHQLLFDILIQLNLYEHLMYYKHKRQYAIVGVVHHDQQQQELKKNQINFEYRNQVHVNYMYLEHEQHKYNDEFHISINEEYLRLKKKSLIDRFCFLLLPLGPACIVANKEELPLNAIALTLSVCPIKNNCC